MKKRVCIYIVNKIIFNPAKHNDFKIIIYYLDSLIMQART